MKNMIFATLFIMTFGQAFAQTSALIEYSGESMVALTSNNNRVDTIEINIQALVKEAENGRISIFLKSGIQKRCIGFAIRALGESDGFGNYDLFENKQAYLENKVMGSMQLHGDTIRLQLNDFGPKKTKGSDGFSCEWDFGRSFYLELTKR